MKHEDVLDANKGFGTLGLHAKLIQTLSELGYEEPTPIQREAIPPLLTGRDIIGQAATGTGKTAAFALPMVQRISETRTGSRRCRPPWCWFRRGNWRCRLPRRCTNMGRN